MKRGQDSGSAFGGQDSGGGIHSGNLSYGPGGLGGSSYQLGVVLEGGSLC